MSHRKFLSKSLLVLLSMMMAFNLSYAQSIEQLVQENPRQALSQIDKELTNNPNDEKALFLQALAYEKLGQSERAQAHYERFIKRFPERPEAYLNLANLHAKKGDTSTARKLLEQGLLSKQAYAKLYRSLKKLNSHLAQTAYQRALSKDKKVAIPELASSSSLALPAIRTREVEVIKEIEVIKEEPTVEANNTTNNATKESVQASEVVQKTKIAEQSFNEQAEIISIVRKWAAKWSEQNVGKFVSFYAPDYSARDKDRKQWLQDRKLKLTNKRFIKVNVKNFSIQTKNNQLVEATFRQDYQSDVVTSISQKRLTFKKIEGNWKIIAEKIIR